MSQLAFNLDRPATGLRLGGSAAMHPHFLSSSSALSTSAGPALEQLKKTADRLIEEQQSTRQATEDYRLKLQGAQRQLHSLQKVYSSEKAENAQLKAKVKDDQQQIQYVTSKVSLVEAMHASLRETLNSLRTDVQHVDEYRCKLTRTIDSRFARCEASGMAIQELSKSKAASEQELTEALQRCEQLTHEMQHLTQTMHEDQQRYQAENDHTVAKLEEATKMIDAHTQAKRELENRLAVADRQAVGVQAQHADQTEAHNKHACMLDMQLQSATATMAQVETELHAAVAKLSSADTHIEALKQDAAEHAAQMQAVQEQLDCIKQNLQAQLSAHDMLLREHAELQANHDELSSALQAVKTDLLSKLTDIEELTAKLLAETAAKDALSGDCKHKLQQITELQDKVASAECAAAELQETHATNLSTMQAELASSKAETAAAKIEAEAAIKEAGVAGEKKIQRLSERTAKEMEKMEEVRRKSKADADTEKTKLQASLQELEAEKTGLAVKLEEKVKLYLDLQVHHSALSATTAAEQQALLDIIEAGKRKLVEQQEQNVKEAAELKHTQNLELQQANHIKSEQEQQIASLQQQISQLQLDHEGQISKHMTEKQQSCTEASAAKDAALKELQSRMDADIQDLKAKVVAGQTKLQDVHNKLQRTEGALSVAHQELNDLKSQFVEQEEAMHELQATLDSKETLLNTISMAACQPAAKESPAGRKKSPEARHRPHHEPASQQKHSHKTYAACKAQAETREAQKRRKSSSKHAAPVDSGEDTDTSEQESSASDGDTEDRMQQVAQRKRAAAAAPKQNINKKVCTEKPAVTQGRRSRFTAMSARTMTSEDDDAVTYRQKRSHKKDDRNAAISSRAKPVAPATNRRVPANAKAKGSRKMVTGSTAMDIFGQAYQA